MATAVIGSELGGYRLEQELSSTRASVAYRAADLATGQSVTLELVEPHLSEVPGFAERLEDDARRAASLQHPHVAAVRKVGWDEGVLHVVSEYADGPDLATLIDRLGGLSFLRGAVLVAQVASALDAAHAAGIVHGALEPVRIVVGDEDGVGHALLTGFGFSGAAGIGDEGWKEPPSAAYASPERARGQGAGPAADVYALGCVLQAVATGRPPFVRDNDSETLRAHVSEQPASPSERILELPAALEDVLAKALAKDPSERYTSAGELARAALAAGGVVPPPGLDLPVEKDRLRDSWQRSIAVGVGGWSPSQGPIAAPPASPPADDVPAEAPGVGEPAKPTISEPAASPRKLPSLPSWSGRRMRIAAAGAAVLGLAVTGALVFSDSEDDEPARAGAQAEPRPGRPAATGLVEWPQRSAYTVVIDISAPGDRAGARARAAGAARLGLPAGVLASGDHPNLEPGRLVSFAGVFPSRPAAERAARRLRERGIARAPYPTFVRRAR